MMSLTHATLQTDIWTLLSPESLSLATHLNWFSFFVKWQAFEWGQLSINTKCPIPNIRNERRKKSQAQMCAIFLGGIIFLDAHTSFSSSCFDLVYVTIMRLRLTRVRSNNRKISFSAFKWNTEITTQSNNILGKLPLLSPMIKFPRINYLSFTVLLQLCICCNLIGFG